MPTYTLKKETGETFDIESPSELSESDLAHVLKTEGGVKPDAEFDQFKAKKIAEGNRGLGARALDSAVQPIKDAAGMVKGLYNTAKGGVQGAAEIAGEASTHGLMAPVEATRNLAQTALESGSRMAFDAGDLARKKMRDVENDPTKIMDLPYIRGIPGTIKDLIGGKPSDAEMEKLYQQKKMDEAMAQEREAGVARNIPIGQANSKLADALPLLAVGMAGKSATAKPLATDILQEAAQAAGEKLPIRPPPLTTPKVAAESGALGKAANIVSNTAKTVKDFSSTFVKTAGEIVSEMADVPIVRNMRSAIKPNAAMGENFAKTAVEHYMPAIYEEAQRAGVPLAKFEDVPGTLIPLGDAALKRTWGAIEEGLKSSGEKGVKLNGNSLADSMVKEGDNARFKIESETNPAMQKKLEAISAQADAYRKDFTPMELEERLQVANVILDTAKQKVKGQISVENLAKVDPELAAEYALAKGIRKMLNDKVQTLGPEYGELKKRWGTLSEFQQAIKTRFNVQDRQQLIGLDRFALSESLSGGPSGVLMAPAKAAYLRSLKHMDTMGVKISKAFQQYEKELKQPVNKQTLNARDAANLEKRSAIEQEMEDAARDAAFKRSLEAD